MKVFIGHSDQRFGYGAYEETWSVVLANTLEEALGMLLDSKLDTVASDWDIDELTKFGVHYITSREIQKILVSVHAAHRST